MSSETRTTFIVQQFRAEPNVIAVGTASTANIPRFLSLMAYARSTQTSTSQFHANKVCFYKRHRTLDCQLIPDEQKKQLVYSIGVNLCVPHTWIAATHGEPYAACPGARQDNHKPNRHTPLPESEAVEGRKAPKLASFKKVTDEALQVGS